MREQSRRTFLIGSMGVVALSTRPSTAPAQVRAGGVEHPAENASLSAEPPLAFNAISTDGTMLWGHAQGDPAAPEILFVHGLRQSRLSWDKQFADPSLVQFRKVAFDLRGHGDSDKPSAIDAYAEPDRWADDIASVIEATGLRRPVLVGWSLGGYAVGAYVRKYGGSGIAGINLVDAVTKLSPDLLSEETMALTKSAISHDLGVRTTATAEFLKACFHQQPTPAEMELMLVVNGMTARAANEGFLQTTTPDLQPVFGSYDGPILLTHGVHDRLVKTEMSKMVGAIHSNSRLSLYAESGHSPFFEESARFGKELAAFLGTTGKN